MAYLQAQELRRRGDQKVLITKDQQGAIEMMAILWVDRDRRYFITNAESMEAAEPIYRRRWRQVNREENAEPQRQELEIPQPKSVKTYYDTCMEIDRHNKQ